MNFFSQWLASNDELFGLKIMKKKHCKIKSDLHLSSIPSHRISQFFWPKVTRSLSLYLSERQPQPATSNLNLASSSSANRAFPLLLPASFHFFPIYILLSFCLFKLPFNRHDLYFYQKICQNSSAYLFSTAYIYIKKHIS